ncbi:MAG: hypothetical protein WBF29_10555 [Syntrophobacteria bacterium]|jgi:hypothetical protein
MPLATEDYGAKVVTPGLFEDARSRISAASNYFGADLLLPELLMFIFFLLGSLP